MGDAIVHCGELYLNRTSDKQTAPLIKSTALLPWQAQPRMAKRPNEGQDAPLREERL